MISNTVSRDIPPELKKGIAEGTLKVWGGVVRDLRGRIIGHLQFHDLEALERINSNLSVMSGQLQVLQSLQMASVALQGLNLGVSIVGFAIVCHKLNGISRQLSGLDGKVDQILQGQHEAEWQREQERRAKLLSSLEALASGLRMSDNDMINGAIKTLRESAVFNQLLCNQLAIDAKNAYLEGELLDKLATTVVATRLTIAHAEAHRGRMSEALILSEQLFEWHDRLLSVLKEPVIQQPVSGWLGTPQYQQCKAEWQGLVRNQSALAEGVFYSREQFKLCEREKLTLTQLTSLTTEAEPFAFLAAA